MSYSRRRFHSNIQTNNQWLRHWVFGFAKNKPLDRVVWCVASHPVAGGQHLGRLFGRLFYVPHSWLARWCQVFYFFKLLRSIIICCCCCCCCCCYCCVCFKMQDLGCAIESLCCHHRLCRFQFIHYQFLQIFHSVFLLLLLYQNIASPYL